MCLTIVQWVFGQTAESWQSLCSRKQALLTWPARNAGPPCGRASIPVPPCRPHQANPSSGSSYACPCCSLRKPWVRSQLGAIKYPREPAGAIKYQTTVTKEPLKIELPCKVSFLALHAKRHKMGAIMSAQVRGAPGQVTFYMDGKYTL